ncbi:ABC transporter ATP-binding protein [Peptoanaerobacter stomatis]
MSQILTVENIKFSYEQDKQVLKGISFNVNSGEVVCILGANGCGKTTLLSILSGQRLPDEGKVLIDGNDISHMKPEELAKNVAIVFQEHHAPFPYRVIEVVRMGRAPHIGFLGVLSKQDKEIADEALKRVGLFHLRDKPYTKISGGERQLTLIARAIAQGTKVIFMDEPSSHLDFHNQILVSDTVKKMSEETNIAVIMTTHMPYQAWLYETKAALMSKGHMIKYGRSSEVMTDESLSEIYHMNIRVIKSYQDDLKKEFITCMPILAN